MVAESKDVMYAKLPNLVLGFHGCNDITFSEVIYKHKHLKKSENTYDWLGHGIYFWENGYERALEWAKAKYGNKANVIGAVIDLGLCLNLTDSRSTAALQKAYPLFVEMCKLRGEPIPQNKKGRSDTDVLLRDLDCAVIEQLHDLRKLQGREEYDSVRGVFVEGKPIFPGSAIAEKTHVQICVVNPNCIKGYFYPLTPQIGYKIP